MKTCIAPTTDEKMSYFCEKSWYLLSHHGQLPLTNEAPRRRVNPRKRGVMKGETVLLYNIGLYLTFHLVPRTSL